MPNSATTKECYKRKHFNNQQSWIDNFTTISCTSGMWFLFFLLTIGKWHSQKENSAWWRKLTSYLSSVTVRFQVNMFVLLMTFFCILMTSLLEHSMSSILHYVLMTIHMLSQWSSSTRTTSSSNTPAPTWTGWISLFLFKNVCGRDFMNKSIYVNTLTYRFNHKTQTVLISFLYLNEGISLLCRTYTLRKFLPNRKV